LKNRTASYPLLLWGVSEVDESTTEVTIVGWLKNDGNQVERNGIIAELASNRANLNT